MAYKFRALYIQDNTFLRANHVIVWFFFFFVALIIFLTSLKRNAVEITKDDAFSRKECSAALRTFLRVSAGVSKPLSVVESYCFSRMNILHSDPYIFPLLVKFCNACTQLKCGRAYIRRRMRISWTEKNKNEEVMEMTGYKRFLLKTIRKRTTSVFGHIN